MNTFKLGDRIRFAYPNAPWGAGQIIEVSQDPVDRAALKPYAIRLDTPYRAFREGRWHIYPVAYADEGQLEYDVDEHDHWHETREDDEGHDPGYRFHCDGRMCPGEPFFPTEGCAR